MIIIIMLGAIGVAWCFTEDVTNSWHELTVKDGAKGANAGWDAVREDAIPVSSEPLSGQFLRASQERRVLAS